MVVRALNSDAKLARARADQKRDELLMLIALFLAGWVAGFLCAARLFA